jgi:hypothetical protein
MAIRLAPGGDCGDGKREIRAAQDGRSNKSRFGFVDHPLVASVQRMRAGCRKISWRDYSGDAMQLPEPRAFKRDVSLLLYRVHEHPPHEAHPRACALQVSPSVRMLSQPTGLGPLFRLPLGSIY